MKRHSSFSKDCMIFIKQANAEIRHFTYGHLSKLDSASIGLFLQKLLSTTNIEALRNSWNYEQITSMLGKAHKKTQLLIFENRRKLNTSAGYDIIDGSKEALSHVDYGSIALQSATRILLLSDGLQLPIWR